MFTALRIGNFKAFAETQTVPIKPLTLIFGANSAGKSSIIHGLLLAHHAMRTGELDSDHTLAGGRSVDLGGFRSYVHRRDTTRVVHWSMEVETSALSGYLAELLVPVRTVTLGIRFGIENKEVQKERWTSDERTGEPVKIKVPTGEFVLKGPPAVVLYDIEADGRTIVRFQRQSGGDLGCVIFDSSSPVFQRVIQTLLEEQTTTEGLQPEDTAAIEAAVKDAQSQLVISQQGLFPRGIQRSTSNDLERLATLVPVSRGRRADDLRKALAMWLPHVVDELVKGLTAHLEATLGQLHYLGPLRSFPPRHLASTPHDDANWHAGGGFAYDLLQRNADTRAAINAWLSSEARMKTPYELVLREFVALDELEGPLLDGIEGMNEDALDMEPDYDGKSPEPTGAYPIIRDPEEQARRLRDRVAQSQIDRLPELVLWDKRTSTPVSHRDVGIGISQVLPVLVAAMTGRNELWGIEQPEIHLHPALQAELADVFIDSAFGERKNTFVLETHSEHLILRILRRIRETTAGELPEGMTPILADQISVLYVQPGKNGSEVVHIPVNADGEFDRPWPEGFFAERVRELF